jgi:phage terminase small subunit
MENELTQKQKRFIEEYLIDLNGTQAAIRAGYSPDTANEIASQNLAKLNIKGEINKALAERSKRTGVNQDRVIQELAKIAFVNLTDLIDTNSCKIKPDATREDTATLLSVKVKKTTFETGESEEREIKLMDKLKALELLSKHLGLFKDSSLNVNIGVKILDDIKDDENDEAE